MINGSIKTSCGLTAPRASAWFATLAMAATLTVATTVWWSGLATPLYAQRAIATATHPYNGVSSSLAILSQRDSALIVGTLPNGLRYYIRTNRFPVKRANLWLAVNAGSIHEDEDQRGFAHFVEHMAFNGTKNFPGNTLIDFVEQTGMTFGADLNAYTNFEETVYQLTIPTDDQALFDRAFQVVDDWASGRITMDSMDVVGERGVVLGEWRARLPDTASRRFQQSSLERTYGIDSRFAKRLPIGSPELIRTATPSPLQRFYHDWYRPDLMAIIAVGDFDAKAVEQQILHRFGDIPTPKAPRLFERPKITAKPTTVVHSIREQIRPEIEFQWRSAPLSDNPELAVKRELINQIVLPYLQQNLVALSKKERRPYAGVAIGNGAGESRVSDDRFVLRLVAAPDSLLSGLRAALTEVERVAQHGLSTDILEREKRAILREYEALADGSASIESRSFAQRYAQHYLSGKGILIGPKEKLEVVRKVLPLITSDAIASTMRSWRAPKGRIATIYVPKFAPIAPITESDVLSLLTSVAQVKVAAVPESNGQTGANTTEKRQQLLANPPSLGNVISTQYYAHGDVTVWQLSNGARVVYKATTSHPDQVLVHAYSLGGHSLLPDSLFASPARLVSMLMTASGGLGNADHDALTQEMRKTGLQEFHVGLNAFDEEIVIGGSPRELENLFQLMYLQFTAPHVDTLALDDWRRNGQSTLRWSPNDQLAFRYSGHRRLSSPSPVAVPFFDLEQAMRVYRDRFGDASDFTFYIVGAASSTEILPLVERYVASLPSKNRTEREIPRNLNIPVFNLKEENRLESAQQLPERANIGLSFFGAIPQDSSQYLVAKDELTAVSWILGRRFRNELREKMAVTYNASAPLIAYWTPDPRYSIAINVTTAPEALDTTIATIWNEIKRFEEEGPTDEELSMVTQVRSRRFENASQNNEWWIQQLQTYDRLGISFDRLGSEAERPLTKDGVRDAARRYIPKNTYVFQTVLPIKQSGDEKKSSVKK